MADLFDNTEAPMPATATELVEEYGHKPEVVKKWTREKSEARLNEMRRLTRKDINHGLHRAAEEVPEEKSGLNEREIVARIDAAEYLRQEMAAGDGERLLIAISTGLYALARQELLDLAPLMVRTLRVHPETGDEIVGKSILYETVPL